ncbi:unnamed protein product [Closterium sp. NIES-65]|nr:unnamed protein product [Closterium sp. NIES-65]
MASKPDYLVFGSAFGFEALAIPLCTGGGPLPSRHCSVLLVVRPGDLLFPDEEEIGTFYRHLDPKTSSKRHEEEAANVLRFFGECVKAELSREGRGWTAKPPFAEVLAERLESLAAPVRDVSFLRRCRIVAWAIVVEASTHPCRGRHVLGMLMQKSPDILRQEVAGTGLLAVNVLAWSLEHLEDVHRSYDPLIVENPKMVGLKALRLELVHHVEKAASNSREAASTVGCGVGAGIALGGEAEEAAAGSHSGGHGPTDGGEEEHEREDGEGGGEQDGGSDEEEEDEKREEDDVVVTGEVEAVQFAGEKVADKSGGSGPKSGKNARGSGGSTPTRIASKAAVDGMKVAERENKKLREKLVAEKRLEHQTARIDALYSMVTATVNKLLTVAESVTSHEQTSGRSLQTAVDTMRAVVQEAVSYRVSTLEFMNAQWLPTLRALHLTATAAQSRRHEDDVLLLRGVADALGEKIKTVMSAEVKAAMESEAQGIAAAVTAQVVQELRDNLVKAVTSATQQGLGTAGFSLLPTALASVMHGGRATAEEHGPAPRQSGKRVADEKSLTGDQTSGNKRSRGPAAKRGVGVDPPAAPYPSFDEYLKWLEDQGQKTPVIPPTHSNQAVDQGVEAANVTAATAGPSASAVEAAVWRVVEEAGGVDEEILASIVMPDREIEVMREKLQAAAPTLGAQQGTPAASTAPAEDHSAAGAKSPPATTGEVGDGKHKRKGKDKAKGGPAKAGSSKGTSKAVAQGWKGSGVRVDASTGLATSEMKFGKKSRYICRSMDKSEAAYCIAVAVSSYDGFVSDVILDEFGGVKEDVMAQYKAEWNLARLIPGAMWTVMWTVMWRECLPRQTNATAEVAAGERGAAAIVRGASKEFAKRCKSVIEVVLQRASSRKVGVEEVADTVTKDLHGVVLRLLPEDGDERDHDDLIARVMIENLAFWGDCCVGGPKLKARGVNLPLDAGMKVIVRNRGARDQHKGKQAADA